MSSAEEFSFCESIWATGRSKWHVRRLTPGVGRKLGGGIDTSSLCGLVTSGWDLNIPLNQLQLNRTACDKCRDAVLEEIPLDSLPARNTPHSTQH